MATSTPAAEALQKCLEAVDDVQHAASTAADISNLVQKAKKQAEAASVDAIAASIEARKILDEIKSNPAAEKTINVKFTTDKAAEADKRAEKDQTTGEYLKGYFGPVGMFALSVFIICASATGGAALGRRFNKKATV
jgi:hypothetical protein